MSSLIPLLRGFKFNNKHNSEFGVAMETKTIQYPSKKKIKDSVPFMNGSYDFSTIGSNNEIVYEEREITIVLGLPAKNKDQLQFLYSTILEWLVDTGKQKLVFDGLNEYYFMAEVESNSSLAEVMTYGRLELKFVAEPFKKSEYYVGNDIWDIFNFEEDYAQDTKYTINNSTKILIYNPGRTIRPIIKSSNNMTMIDNKNKSYTINIGENNLYGFHLLHGLNNITFNGSGNVEFIFRKEKL